LIRISVLLCIGASFAACGTNKKSIDESEAVVSLDHPRFANASSDFTITRDGFTGQAAHSSAYRAEDSIAHLLVLSAGTREYIEDIEGHDDVNRWCERTFFNQGDDENTTPIPSPLWRDSGSVEAGFGEVLYRKLAVGNRDCACFAHGWGTRANRYGDRSSRVGGAKLMLGYVCDESQNLARTEVESLINAIDLKKR
jgi:hypothetical protein